MDHQTGKRQYLTVLAMASLPQGSFTGHTNDAHTACATYVATISEVLVLDAVEGGILVLGVVFVVGAVDDVHMEDLWGAQGD